MPQWRTYMCYGPYRMDEDAFNALPPLSTPQIPYVHFYTKNYDNTLLRNASLTAAERYPWPQRKPVAFSRFSGGLAFLP